MAKRQRKNPDSKTAFDMDTLRPVVICSDARRIPLADGSVHCVVTSPPYWGLRAYGGDPGMIGLEPMFDDHLGNLVEVFREVRRVLRDDGTLWLNYGDAYWSNPGNYRGGGETINLEGSTPRHRSGMPRVGNEFKPKDLMMMPARVAMALQAEGWWLRSEIVWHKPNPMPESVTDRPTSSHEKVFLLTEKPRYFYDADAVRVPVTGGARPRVPKAEDGSFAHGSDERGIQKNWASDSLPTSANLRNVWKIPTHGFSGGTETCRLALASSDALSDDMMHIASQDCPHHGGLSDRVPMAFCGERVADETTRTLRKHSRPFRVQSGALVPVVPLPDGWSLEQSSDCFRLLYSLSATGHNRENRKKALDPSTSPAYSASAENQDHTERKSMSHGNTAPFFHNHENNILPDDSGAHPSAQTQCRNASKSSSDNPPCICTIYEIETKKTSHFATFPPALAKRCILAGTSAAGVCAGCGAPWARPAGKWLPGETTGWLPSCTCDAGRVPATVFDPFGGSGTVGICAEELGRRSVLTELSPEYCTMARERIDAQQPSLPLLG